MIVTAREDGMLAFEDLQARCALGRSGVIEAAAKREGDGASPLGFWPIRRVLYRPDKGSRPETVLPVLPLTEADGWCDAPGDAAYNLPVTLPYPASAERMWREDGAYDIVVVLGHNDNPVVDGLGSAIFWHLAKPGYPPTEGCVAIAEADMRAILRRLSPGAALAIVRTGPEEA